MIVGIKKYCLRLLPEPVLQIVKKIHYLRTLKSFKENDEIDLKVIRYLVNSGDYVIDIGANIGVYTKYLSEFVWMTGRVYSIEPIIPTFKILSYNVKKMRLKNVKLMNYAISDTVGFVIMEVPLYELGGENFYQAKIVSGNTNSSIRRVRVKSDTIDSLFSSLPHKISFIKCDVEGHEINCIKGAKGIIENSKPAWLIEVSGNPDDPFSSAYETFQKLNGEGYEAFWFDGTNLIKRHFGDKSVNYFFITKKHEILLRNQNTFLVR